jgi:hypothetical protein
MELDEFISKTLQQIVDGVESARRAKGNEIVNPTVVGIIPSGKSYVNERLIHYIDFDVAVTVQDSRDTQGGGKISVLGMNLGGKMDASTQSQTVTRIKFDVPLAYSEGKVK